jgi:molybdopterin/thiamine biosynthesis adenylyltransferase
MIEPAIVLPKRYADSIAASGKRHGTLDIKWSDAEQLGLIDGLHIGVDGGGGRTGMSDLTRSWHALANLPRQAKMGLWYRVDSDLHFAGLQARIQSGALPLDAFKSAVLGPWTTPSPTSTITVTCTTIETDDGDKLDHWAGWVIQGAADQAIWCALAVVDEAEPLLAPLTESWPLQELADVRVLLIGVGSIGSAAAQALASAGIRHLTLVDPDRLLSHNFARHRVHPSHVGRFKVDAMRGMLRDRDPDLEIDALRLDVVNDADQLRPLLSNIDVAVVSVDGVEPRRVANHLIRKAGKSAVFACVLENGAFGEVIRLEPNRTGCLLCTRAALRQSGGIDPEPALDRGYGIGTRHLPMTAVTTDLGLVGDVAAKAALATLLEPSGFRDQRLAGDHAILSLRPKPGRAAPFDIERAGEIRWHPLPRPRADCPSCSQ